MLEHFPNGSYGITCVESCPVGTFQSESSECMPCHEHCDINAGCGGPLPFLDRDNGCRDCSLVQLTRSGRQVSIKIQPMYCPNLVFVISSFEDICMSNVCSTGYYKAVLSSTISNNSGLEFGTDVCVPCNDVCVECYGPETVLGSNGCQSCKYAQQWSPCEEECITTGNRNSTNRRSNTQCN